MAEMAGLAPIAISMGEPAGIGPDLILKLYSERSEHDLPPFVVMGSMAFLAARARRLGLNLNFAETTAGNAVAEFPVALPVVHIEGLVPDKPGETSALSGKVVIESISRAVGDTLSGGLPRRRHRAHPQGRPLYGRLQISRPHRISCRALRQRLGHADVGNDDGA